MTREPITAIVVSKGLDALLWRCLDGLRAALDAAPGGPHHVVVVDNASPVPYRRADLPVPVELIRLDTDTSFAAANNRAAHRVPGARLLLVNNDVLLAPEAARRMGAVLDAHPLAGICGTRLWFPDGTVQHDGVVFGDGATGPYHRARGRRVPPRAGPPRQWQAVTGACMLVRGEAWAALSGLDETFGFGLEDIDLCLRARQAGWQVWCDHAGTSLHLESFTPGRVAKDVPSRRHFMARWGGRYAIDG